MRTKMLEEYISNKIKERDKSLVSVANMLNLNYHTLKSQLRNGNLGGDSLMKISCLLDINLEELKKEVYGELNKRLKEIQESEFLTALKADITLDEEYFDIVMTIYKEYGEELAKHFVNLDYALNSSMNNLNELEDLEESEDIEERRYLVDDTFDKMKSAIIKYHLIPLDSTVKESVAELVECTIEELLDYNKDEFKALKALYENSVFKNKLDMVKMVFGYDLDNEFYFPRKHGDALMALSADGYSSAVGDYFEVIELEDKFLRAWQVGRGDRELSRKYALKIYELSNSIYRALVNSDIDDDLKNILRMTMEDRIVCRTVGFYDCNVEDSLKILTKEDKEKWASFEKTSSIS